MDYKKAKEAVLRIYKEDKEVWNKLKEVFLTPISESLTKEDIKRLRELVLAEKREELLKSLNEIIKRNETRETKEKE